MRARSHGMEIRWPGSLALGSQQPWDPRLRLEPDTFLIPTSSGSGSRGPAFLVGHSEGHQTLKTTAASIPQLHVPCPLGWGAWGGQVCQPPCTGPAGLSWGGEQRQGCLSCPGASGAPLWTVSGPKEEICTKIPSGLRVALGFPSPCNPSCHLLGPSTLGVSLRVPHLFSFTEVRLWDFVTHP